MVQTRSAGLFGFDEYPFEMLAGMAKERDDELYICNYFRRWLEPKLLASDDEEYGKDQVDDSAHGLLLGQQSMARSAHP